MSYSTVLGVVPGRRPTNLLELSNSHGWAPSIWDRAIKHLYGYDGYLFHGEGEQYLNRSWREIDDHPEWVQIPLVLTFDTGVIPAQVYRQAADMLDEFDRRLPAPSNRVNHLSAVAELLRSVPEVPLIGVYGTSVSENPFDPWDEEADDHGPGIGLGDMYVLKRHRPLVMDLFPDV